MKPVIIDIETYRDIKPGYEERARSRVKVPKNYTREPAIMKYIEDNWQQVWAETALDMSYGSIGVICCAHKGDMIEVSRLPGESEADMLISFWHQLETLLGREMQHRTPLWAGHNVCFDLEGLWKRCRVLDIDARYQLPWRDAVWKGSYIDTMYLWGGTQKRIKLTELCRILGISVDTDEIDGSQVWDAVQEPGGLTKVIEHCRADVLRVDLILERLL